MLVDRLQYLPGNEIEGNQTLMIRAINGEEASTNLVVHLFVIGSEKFVPEQDGGLLPGFSSSLVMISLLGAATLSSGSPRTTKKTP